MFSTEGELKLQERRRKMSCLWAQSLELLPCPGCPVHFENWWVFMPASRHGPYCSSCPAQMLLLLPKGCRALSLAQHTRQEAPSSHATLLSIHKDLPNYLITNLLYIRGWRQEVFSLFNRLEKGRKEATDLMNDLKGTGRGNADPIPSSALHSPSPADYSITIS